MPLASKNLPRLNEREVAIIKKWIDQGAVYEPHWAFVVPKKQAIPEVKNKQWPINEIDFFILKKMEEKGLEPNEQASKERLAKRVYMDLVGILPTPQEMQLFVNDTDPKAYEKLVDRLMAQPQYGERMAISWMDIARFSDSHGFQDDSYRSQWPWRDWVIYALNKNMRYDTFITWQLAGDLLPNPTKEQLLATGFNRNHKITEEGGGIKALGTHPRKTEKKNVGEENLVLEFGGVKWIPGGWVAADEDGVVVAEFDLRKEKSGL